MTILGRGDLSPPRRSGFGYRRRRRWPRLVLVLLLVAAVAAGGYEGWRHFRHHGRSAVRTLPQCPTPTPSQPAPVGIAGPSLLVLNGSLRPGLAAQVAHGLQHRFSATIRRVGNAAAFQRGASVVRFPASLAAEARAVAAAVVPAARLVPTAGNVRVELDIGTRFQRLATQSEFTAAVAPPTAAPTAVVTASPTRSPCAAA
ncbi:MAG: LytR C-terminal domain-containing protein [Frankiales bacterium]|nr:LytR C-terminal domain-containing protein [Frankiales bacterium]